MRAILLLVFILCSSLQAIELNIHLNLEQDKFTFRYEFEKSVSRFIFTYNPQATSLFNNLTINENDESISVDGDSVTLQTYSLDKILFTGDETKFFLLNDQTMMIYSYALDVLKVELENGEQEIVERVKYFQQGTLIHERDINDETSFEKYLIIEGSDLTSKVDQENATLYIDTDLPHRNFHIKKINKALSYLYQKFGAPLSKPVVFFSYKPGVEKDIQIEGRNLIYDNVIMLSAGSLENVELEAKNFRLYFYNLLYSHEIIHHWTSKNLDNQAHGWVHEGAAEALSHIMVKELFAEEAGDMAFYMRDYNYRHCQVRSDVFDFAYHCGAVIWDQVFQNITSGSDPFQIMKEVMRLPKQSEQAVLEVFIRHTNSQVMESIDQIINSKYEQ